MRILLCGLGSIGKRHARLLKQHDPSHQLFALRTFKGQEKNDLGVSELVSWQEVDRQAFDVAFITNPTCRHIEYALECAKRGMHLFLEKPVDCKIEGLDSLLSLVEQKRLTAYVAYPLRFHPVIREMKSWLSGQNVLHSRAVCGSYLPDWRPEQDHLKSYSSHRDQGGGVLLDLSHDIDLVQFLFGEIREIRGQFGRRGSVTVDSEDYADLLLTHASGTTNLHLNYFSRRAQRFLEVDTTTSFLRADLVENRLELTQDNKVVKRDLKMERDDCFVTQLDYFFQNLGNMKLQNNLFEASRLFRKIIRFRGES